MSDWFGLSENSKSGLARSEVFTNTSCHGKRRFSSDNIYTQLVQKFGTMGGEIEVLWLHSNFGNRSKERTGLDRIGPDGELAIGPRLGVRVAIGWTVVCEEKNLLASKRSSLLPLLLDRPAGPFSSGLNIRTLLALSNSSRLIESPPSPPQGRSGRGHLAWEGLTNHYWPSLLPANSYFSSTTTLLFRAQCEQPHNCDQEHNPSWLFPPLRGHNPLWAAIILTSSYNKQHQPVCSCFHKNVIKFWERKIIENFWPKFYPKPLD